jgi:hypothetical protein
MGGGACSYRKADQRDSRLEEACEEVEESLQLGSLDWSKFEKVLALYLLPTEQVGGRTLRKILMELELWDCYTEHNSHLRVILNYVLKTNEMERNLHCLGLFYCAGSKEERAERLWFALGGDPDGCGTVSLEVAEAVGEVLVRVAAKLIPSLTPHELGKQRDLLEGLPDTFFRDLASHWLPPCDANARLSKDALAQWVTTQDQFTPARARELALKLAKKHATIVQNAKQATAKRAEDLVKQRQVLKT